MARYTPNQLAEQVERMLQAFRPTSDHHIDKREIKMRLKDRAAELMNARRWEQMYDGERRYGQRPKAGGEVYHGWLMTFENIDVEEDGDKCYSELPAEPLELPENDAIQHVFPETGTLRSDIDQEPIIPIPTNATTILRTLPAGALEQRFGYEAIGDRIYYTTRRGKTILDEGIDTVKMVMVTVNPQEARDDDPLPISPHLRNDLLIQTLALFGIDAEKALDLIKDNV